MKNWTLAEEMQIKAILADKYSDLDILCEKLRPDKNAYDLTFYDVFTVSLQDVYAYVLQHGWDSRIICVVEKYPNDGERYEKNLTNISWFVHPSTQHEGKWMISAPGDRGEVLQDEFDSLEKLRKRLIQTLFNIQWSHVNHRYDKKNNPNVLIPLSKRFPLSPKWDD
jgi:hypothetical protein